MRKWIVIAVGACAVGFVACSAPDVEEEAGAGGSPPGSSGQGGSGATAGPSGSTSGTGSGGSTSSTGSATTGSGGGVACGQLSTWEACEACECDLNEAGCDRYWELEDDACYCGANAPCAAQCTVYCGNDDDELDPACDACDDDLDDVCFDAAQAACAGDADCSAYMAALNDHCDPLPDP